MERANNRVHVTARPPRVTRHVRLGQNKNAVPAERSALLFAHRTWPGACRS